MDDAASAAVWDLFDIEEGVSAEAGGGVKNRGGTLIGGRSETCDTADSEVFATLSLNHLLQFAVVYFSCAEFGNLFQELHFAGHGDVRQSVLADYVANVLQFDFGLVGHGDQRFAFLLVGTADYGYLAAQSVLRKRSGQCLFDSRKAHHFAADLCESFEASQNKQKAFLIDPHDISRVIPTFQSFELFV